MTTNASHPDTATPPEGDEYIGPAAAAALLGIKVRTLKAWESRGWVTAHRLPNGYRRYSRQHLLAVMDQRAAT